MTNMYRLRNKWALVTGSSRGIGQQIALGLAQEGCNIIVHARTPENTAKTLKLLSTFNIETLVVAGELGIVEDEKRIVQQIVDKIGYVDILYNNAAIMSNWSENIFEIPMDEWKKVFEINFFSMVRICEMLIPIMIKRGWGRVINLSSGIKNTPQLLPYSVTKAAVDKYTQDLASELTKKNVLVNAVDPGWIKTDLGGENADFEIESVLPGVMVPALLADYTESGKVYRAQDYKKHS